MGRYRMTSSASASIEADLVRRVTITLSGYLRANGNRWERLVRDPVTLESRWIRDDGSRRAAVLRAARDCHTGGAIPDFDLYIERLGAMWRLDAFIRLLKPCLSTGELPGDTT